MSPALFTDICVFVLALLVGVEVIGKVPVTLHTPLMSGGNAIHGVVVVGVMLVAAATSRNTRLVAVSNPVTAGPFRPAPSPAAAACGTCRACGR